MLGKTNLLIFCCIMVLASISYGQDMDMPDTSMMEQDSAMHQMMPEKTAAENYEIEGDSLRAAFDTDGALQAFLNANKEVPENSTYVWKIVREYADKGVFAKDDDDIKSNYAEAESWARKCVDMAPESGDCHLYLSIAVGRVALFEGGNTKIKLSKEVRSEAIKSIELNPNLDGAYHVLARWNREVVALPWFKKAVVKIVYGGLPDATNEDAVKNFDMAIDLRPDRMLHYFELGITYKYMGEKEKARKNFDKCLSMDIRERQDAGRQDEAREFLADL